MYILQTTKLGKIFGTISNYSPDKQLPQKKRQFRPHEIETNYQFKHLPIRDFFPHKQQILENDQ